MTANRMSIAAILVTLTFLGMARSAAAQESTSSVAATGSAPVPASSGRPAAAVSADQTPSSTAAPSPSPSPSPTSQPAITPMTPREKFEYAAYQTFLTPGAYVGPAVNAYFVERRDVKALGKKNNDKFADGLSRFGRAFATRSTEEFLSLGVYPVLFKQNPVYQRSGKQGFMPRTAYALSRAFVTSGDNGKTQPNFSRLLGNLTSASLANLYERDTVRHRDRFGRVSEFNHRVGATPTLKRFGYGVAFDAFSHVLFDEFKVLKKILKVP